MAEVPPTPRPRKRPAKTAPEGRSPQATVTTDAPDTSPDRDAPPVDLAAAAEAARKEAAGRPAGGGGSSRQRATRPTARDKLQASLEELLSMPALIYGATGDEWAASFVAERAPIMAEAWVDLGEQNPAVKRVLVKLTTGSAWGGVLLATGGTVLPLLIHHNLIPDLGLPMGPSSEGSPIVPPPPQGPPPSSGPGVGRTPPPPRGHTGMTPPVKEGQPPGVVTVAGSNNNAVG